MYEKMNYILSNYLCKTNDDSSLLISGKWGCGKTYYIKNGINEVIENSKFNILYISLNGLSEVSEIKRKIFLIKLKEEHGKELNIDFIDQINELGKMIPKVKNFFAITDILAKKSFANLNLSLDHNLLIFDDLERISTKLEIDEVFGYIYDNFIYKGIKTLFVGNDSELSRSNNGYDRIKEKIFRRIIDFHPDIELLCINFIDTHYADNPIYGYICSKIELLSWFIEEIEERNLRTLEFALDIFNTVYTSIKNIDEIKENIETIFINIIILSIEFKNGKINSYNMKNKNGLDKAKEEDFSKELAKHMNSHSGKNVTHKEEDKKYSELFHEKYVEKFGLNFVFIDSIFKYIISGYLNDKEMNAEIQNLFNKKIDEWEFALQQIVDNHNIEEDELIENIKKVIQFLYEGKYKLSRFPYIYSVLNYIKILIYNGSWDFDDLEEMMMKAVYLAVKVEQNIPTIREIENIDHLYYDESRNTPFYQKLVGKIKEFASDKDTKTLSEQLNELLDYSMQDSRLFAELYHEIDRQSFFEKLYITGIYKNIIKLNNRGIRRIGAIAHENILRISNAGEFYYPEKKYIDKIIEYIEEEYNETNTSKLKNLRMQELIDIFGRASEHLEKTKKDL